MTRKEEKTSVVLPVKTDRASESVANPTGAARRRLLRAIGGSGSVALGAVMTSQWQKPVIKAVMLPAHAQTSTALGPVGNCPITVNITSYFASHSSPYTLSVYVSSAGGGTTVMNQLVSTGTFNTVSLSGSSTFPPGSYLAGMSVEHASNAYFSASYNASCCTAVFRGQTVPPSISQYQTFWAQAPWSISDDGQCSFG